MTDFIPVCEPLLEGRELEYITEAVNTGWISSSGKYVEQFENAFAQYCGVKYGVSVCNGTLALYLALVSLGVGVGDEVIIPSFTMIATAFAVCYTGAMPVFVDADYSTWNIDTKKIESKITKKTKAIIPVHIFGNPCNMDDIKRITGDNHLYIIEDSAEAHGAEYKGEKVGSFSSISAFSFFANKILTTGEGGMCLTDNKDFADRCRYYRNMCFPIGGPRNYIHDDIGYNFRMSNLHAAIGLAQTEKADNYRDKRILVHELYRKYLSECPGIIFQKDTENSINVHWMNAIVIDSAIYGHTRDELMQHLKKNGIETRLLFVSMSRQPSLINYGCDCSDSFVVTDWLSQNGLYLPSSSDLDESKISHICKIIKDYYK